MKRKRGKEGRKEKKEEMKKKKKKKEKKEQKEEWKKKVQINGLGGVVRFISNNYFKLHHLIHNHL